ncbi:MAG: 2-dehydropantoate 2-reductase [Acidobacteria bacterium]|nr:2-dehydropantoate 2-reductase [Acidobacteriota bacterium]MBV9480948.1 2-dehydropantoate 2-reductase [Acidobacteriota bacterium]
MRFVIAGAGAIGAYIGACLSRAGFQVTLFARGSHLRAMQERGVQVRAREGDFEVRPRIVGSLLEAGPADVLVLGVKAHSLPEFAPQVKAVLSPDTTVLSTQNGVPWWFFQGFGGRWEGTRLERVDPGGSISRVIQPKHILGSIVYFSTEITMPGVIQHIDGNRISLGELDGTRSDRGRRIAQALISSGLKAPITTRIRHEIWVKLLGNVAFNPVSALTGCTLVEMTRDPELSQVIREIMKEVQAVGAKLGLELPVSIEQRTAGAEKVGEHKTSMLQDLERGRPLELEAVVGAVIELADRMGVPVPHTQAVYAFTKALSRKRQRS